jgi:hypothetical protein
MRNLLLAKKVFNPLIFFRIPPAAPSLLKKHKLAAKDIY